MATSDIPDVRKTELDRDDLVEAAEEVGLDQHEELDDQQLFEEIGRRLGEIEDDSSQRDAAGDDEQRDDDQQRDDDEAAGEQHGEETSGDMSDQTNGAAQAEQSGPDPEDMTRDQLRDELRQLGLPVSGSKSDLLDRVETARQAAARATSDAAETAQEAGQQAQEAAGEAAGAAKDTAEDAAGAAEETAGEAADAARDTAEDAAGTAEDAAGEARETSQQAGQAAKDTAEDAGEAAKDTVEDTGQAAKDTAEQAAGAAEGREAGTEDEESFEQDPEYRLEEDQREGVVPLLDVEVGPLALDLLGLEVRLNRLHPVIVVNSEPKHALLGKLLSGVAGTADKLGLSKGAGKAVEGVEKVVDTLPSPSGDDGTGESEDGGDEEGGQGLLRRLGSRAMNSFRSAGSAASHTGDAAGNAGHAIKDTVTSGGKVQAAREAKQAGDDLGDAASATKDALTGK